MRPIRFPAQLVVGTLLILLTVAAVAADVEVVKLDQRGPVEEEPAGIAYEVAVLSGAGWKHRDIERALEEAKAVFAPCGVVVHARTVYWLKARSGLQELSETEQVELLAPLGGRRPAVIFVNRTTDGDIAYSYLRTAPVVDRGTAWITRSARPGCVGPLLAHELGHILLNSARHSSNRRNLMSHSCVDTNIAGSQPNTALSESQCWRLRAAVVGASAVQDPP